MSSDKDEHFYQKSEIADMPQSPISPVSQSLLEKAQSSLKGDGISKAEEES